MTHARTVIIIRSTSVHVCFRSVLASNNELSVRERGSFFFDGLVMERERAVAKYTIY